MKDLTEKNKEQNETLRRCNDCNELSEELRCNLCSLTIDQHEGILKDVKKELIIWIDNNKIEGEYSIEKQIIEVGELKNKIEDIFENSEKFDPLSYTLYELAYDIKKQEEYLKAFTQLVIEYRKKNNIIERFLQLPFDLKMDLVFTEFEKLVNFMNEESEKLPEVKDSFNNMMINMKHLYTPQLREKYYEELDDNTRKMLWKLYNNIKERWEKQ